MSLLIFSISLSMATSLRPRSHSRLSDAENSFPRKISHRGLSGAKAIRIMNPMEKDPFTWEIKIPLYPVLPDPKPRYFVQQDIKKL